MSARCPHVATVLTHPYPYTHFHTHALQQQCPRVPGRTVVVRVASHADERRCVNCGSPHRRGWFSVGKAVDPECAFWVEGDRTNLDLEAVVRAEALKWVEALGKLLKVFKTSPQLL